jgi:hypothetical protein
LRWAGRERITLGRDFQRETEKNLRETLHLLNKDDEQDWIEKYRAALLSPPTSRRSRLFAALKSLAGILGLAVGKTSGKMANPVPNSGQPPAKDRSHGHSPESVSRKPSDRRQGKKAS